MRKELFEEKAAELLQDEDTHISPDFQCDQTGGYPVSLCVNWEKGTAWLKLNDTLDADGEDLSAYEQLCADWGFRACSSVEDFNTLLQELGEDAYDSAYIPTEEESGVMEL